MHGGDAGERQADAGDGAGDNELLLARGLHRSHKFGAVPDVNLAAAGEVLRVGRILLDFRDVGTVGTLRNRGAGDNWNLRQTRHLEVRGFGGTCRNTKR